MHSIRWLLCSALCALVVSAGACGGNNNGPKGPQCNDGVDNDGDSLIDFPDDPGCTSKSDDSEDSAPAPQCNDGRDNDGDGKIDYPNDPGCFAPQQDDETDDCPDGPACPQCSNGKDDDMNGLTDYPNDPGCTAAADTDEYTENPAACGSNVHIKQLPFDGHAMGTLMSGGASSLQSPMCGGVGPEDVYELRITAPKVVQASTDSDLTMMDTVLYIRSADCANNSTELACNDDVMVGTNTKSTVTKAISTPGTYYLVVDSKTSAGGMYDLQVKYFVGEGEACSGPDDCGPTLVCRDETDDCPSGPNCPECGNGRDDDGDGHIDYPADPQCISASSASEACMTHETVAVLTQAMTMGDTTGQTDDFHPTCSSPGSTAPDLTYRLDLPQLSVLNINLTAAFDSVTALYNSTCGGTALSCSDPLNMSVTNLAAGSYFFVVDGYSNTGFGPYTITVSGTIPNGAGCEAALVQSGALTCGNGYACKGTVGTRTCQPALCSDGLDNDGDGKIDYPFDPGCASPAGDDETDPAIPPVCSDHLDNDGDTLVDFPADFGCVAASGTTEVFCMPEMDPSSAITTKTTTGTTTGKSNDLTPSCSSFSTASDVSFGLMLPVPVVSLQIDTAGSGFDTVLSFRNASCTTEIACNDDSGGLTSMITLANVAPGGYAVTVDGYSTSNGAFTLNVQGTVAAQTSCTSPLFSGGATAVLLCPTGTTCTGSPAKCK